VIAGQNGIPWWHFYGLDGPHAGRRVESVDPGGAVTAAIPPERAIGCVVYCSTEIEAPGVIRHLEGTRFTIGEPSGSISERCEGLQSGDGSRRAQVPGRGRPSR
jgi:2-dehydropantoate 2-reductase